MQQLSQQLVTDGLASCHRPPNAIHRHCPILSAQFMIFNYQLGPQVIVSVAHHCCHSSTNRATLSNLVG